MAEIKSTLDLVMERTKNLRFSEEEKQAQQHADAKKAFNGLVQQYLDQLIDLDELSTKAAAVRREFQLADKSLLCKAILDTIVLNALDGPLPELLAVLCDADITGLNNLAQDYRQQMTAGREQRIAEIKNDLQTHFEIVGSAVDPNLEADTKWQQEIQKRTTDLEATLLELKSKIHRECTRSR